MVAGYVRRQAKVLRVYCPVQPQTLTAMLAGDASGIEKDPYLSEMVSIIRHNSALGEFGSYRSVIEISAGLELFTPGPGSSPTTGHIGSPTTVPTAVLAVYVAQEVTPEALDQAIAAILQAHPWEVPVIELSETSLLARSGSGTLSLPI